MENNKFANSGVLFASNTKRSERSPDFTGNVELDVEFISNLIANTAKDGKVKIDLAGWKRVSGNGGKAFVSLKASEPRVATEQQSSTPAERPWG